VSLTLCVLLWARDGQQAELAKYEDQVLRLVPDHGGRVLHRARTTGAADEPFEVHLLQFPAEAALNAYMTDERRTSLSDERDRAIARTQVLRVEVV